LISLKPIKDTRGLLTPLDFEKELKFLPRRTFILSASEVETIRGEHAHRVCVQAIQCIYGAVELSIHDGRNLVTEKLSSVEKILIIPVLHWITIKFLVKNSHVAVYASHPYDEDDYLRNFEEFVAEADQISARVVK
jgi:UDP-2-acetamido-3-amino-2,3-dideoxy-glucuronate N-acetyltransferase